MRGFGHYVPFIAVVAAGAGLLTYVVWPKPIRVEFGQVSQGTLQIVVNEDGKTRVRERYVVSSPLIGQLSRITLHAGDPVVADETVLAVIQPALPSFLDARALTEAESRVKAAESAVKQSEGKLDAAEEEHQLASDNFERAAALIVSKSITREDYDQCEHRERMTGGLLRAAQFGLRLARFELDLSQAAFVRTRPDAETPSEMSTLSILAPVSGSVLRVMQESASNVLAGQPLLEVGNVRELELEIDVLSSDAAQIRPGAKVVLKHWGGGAPLVARVRLVEPSGFTKISSLGVEEQRVNVIADFAEDLPREELLGDAFRVEASIVIWEADDVIKVPSGALFRSGEKWAAFVVRAGRASRQIVEIGKNNGREAQVLSGLRSNDVVVVFPSDQVQDGVRVQAMR